MTRSRYWGMVLVLALGATACDSDRVSSPQLSESSDDPIAALLASTEADAIAAGRAGNHLFDRLANAIPGFGGLYRDGRCAVAVVLTDMSEANHAIRVVKKALEPLRACPDGIRVHPVQGEFTYAELVRYQLAARPLLRIDGVRGTTINYQLNRLVIHVAARLVAQTVIEVLPQLGIPVHAVTFQAAGARGD